MISVKQKTIQTLFGNRENYNKIVLHLNIYDYTERTNVKSELSLYDVRLNELWLKMTIKVCTEKIQSRENYFFMVFHTILVSIFQYEELLFWLKFFQ